MDKERHAAKRTERAHQEDVVLNRILIWFGAAVVAETVLLWLGRYYSPHSTAYEVIMLASAIRDVTNIFRWVTLALGVVSAVWLLLAKRQGKRARLPLALTILFLAASAMSIVIYRFSDTGIQFLCRAVLGVTVMALIYYLYQREFFTASAVTAAGILGLWVLRRADGGYTLLLYGYMALVAVLLVAVVAVCRMAQTHEGVVSLGGKKVSLFPKNAGYGMVYLTCGIVAAVLIAALVAGTAVAYYLMFGLVAWIFVMAVYYTVKLM